MTPVLASGSTGAARIVARQGHNNAVPHHAVRRQQAGWPRGPHKVKAVFTASFMPESRELDSTQCLLQEKRHRKPEQAAAAAAAEGAVVSSGGFDQQLAQLPAVGGDGRPAAELRFPDSFYDDQGRLALKNLTLPQLEAWCASIGEDGPKRALQLWRFMYYDRLWVRSLEDAAAARVQNGFSAAFLRKAAPLATLDAGLRLQSVARASDGTRKLVFGLAFGPAAGGQVGSARGWAGRQARGPRVVAAAGRASSGRGQPRPPRLGPHRCALPLQVETVLIPVVRQAGSKERITLCVSSQVGCGGC